MNADMWDERPSDSRMDRNEAKQLFAFMLMAYELETDFEDLRHKAKSCNRMMEYAEERASSN
jgi:proteasome assembly chaperone (PAC2) family protein